MHRFGAFAATILLTLATTADAANDEWVERPVRIAFGSKADAVDGRFMRMDGCLYVRLDAPRDGLMLIRLDQVTRLHVSSGGTWVARDPQPVLAREPAHCLAEANG